MDRRSRADRSSRQYRRRRCRRRGVSRLGPDAAAGAVGDPQALVRLDACQPRGPRRHHDARAGQADFGIARRNRLRSLLHRVLCRGGETPEHRERDLASARRRGGGLARARRRRRARHAVELPLRHDYPQGGRGARRRLHRRRASFHHDAVLRARAGGTRRTRRPARRRVQCRHRRRARDRRRMDGRQARARAVLHRLDRGRQAPLPPRVPTP